MSSLAGDITNTQEKSKKSEHKLASVSIVSYDVDIYGCDQRDSYLHSIPFDDTEEIADATENKVASKLASYTAPKSLLDEMSRIRTDDGDVFRKPQRIIDRENEYQRRRLDQVISPDRNDPFATGDMTPDVNVRTYAEIMREQSLKRQEEQTLRAISKKMKAEEEHKKQKGTSAAPAKRRSRWGQSQDQPVYGNWDDLDGAPSGGEDTHGMSPLGLTWDDSTPKIGGMATPTRKKQRSRWDETPATIQTATSITGAAPTAWTHGMTPFGGIDIPTPTPGQLNLRGPLTPELYNLIKWEKDIEKRNMPLSDEDLDALFPTKGYKILECPISYNPIRTPARKHHAIDTPILTPLYQIANASYSRFHTEL